MARFDSGVEYDAEDVFFDDDDDETTLPSPLPAQPFTLNSLTHMEYWEFTLDRAQKSLPVWETHVPTLKIRGLGTTDLETLINGFQPLVQARVEAQDVADEAFRAVQSSLLKMKLMGTKLPVFIEIQLAEHAGVQKDVDDLFAVNPRSESSILKRAGMLLPVWERANTLLAAMVPAQPTLTLNIQGVAHTAAMLEALLVGYVGLTTMLEKKESLLDGARAALRTHDRGCDRLNKDWYRLVKTAAEAGSPVLEALEGIPTEPSTPAPEVIEIQSVAQGGEDGLQVLVVYVPGGGAHATLKEVQFTLPGDAEPFTRKVPLLAAGNALGPFPVGTLVTLRTAVGNSVGTRTTAPRTLTLEEPIE